MLTLKEDKYSKVLSLSYKKELIVLSWEDWAEKTRQGENLEIITGDLSSVVVQESTSARRLAGIEAPPCRMRFVVALMGAVTVASPMCSIALVISAVVALTQHEERKREQEEYKYYLNEFFDRE
jgi:ABC-type multidrug transport system fused ATPase/permease subunit